MPTLCVQVGADSGTGWGMLSRTHTSGVELAVSCFLFSPWNIILTHRAFSPACFFHCLVNLERTGYLQSCSAPSDELHQHGINIPFSLSQSCNSRSWWVNHQTQISRISWVCCAHSHLAHCSHRDLKREGRTVYYPRLKPFSLPILKWSWSCCSFKPHSRLLLRCCLVFSWQSFFRLI